MDSDLKPTEYLDRLALSILQDLGSTATTIAQAAADERVTKYIKDGLTQANDESVSRAAKVQVCVC